MGDDIGASAVDFFVSGDDDVDGVLEFVGGETACCGDHAGDRTFHVGYAASVDSGSLFDDFKGVPRPPFGGYDVVVSHQGEATSAITLFADEVQFGNAVGVCVGNAFNREAGFAHSFCHGI